MKVIRSWSCSLDRLKCYRIVQVTFPFYLIYSLLVKTAHSYILVCLAQLVAYFVFMHDPFFGDAISSTYQSANYIFNQNLRTLFYPIETDPGHPTLYPFLLAICWKIFGQTIEVAHAFSTFWMLLLSILFVKTTRLFLNPIHTFLAVILMLCFGTYLSLSAMLLNTTMLIFFVLLSGYGLFTQKSKWLLLGNSLMVLTHLQGTFFLVGFGIAQLTFIFIKNRNVFFKNLLQISISYIIPTLLFIGWLYLHYNHTGWFTHSPNYSDTQNLKTLVGFFKSILLISWRIADYGMLPIHVFACLAVFKNKSNRLLDLTYLSLLFANASIMSIFLEHTIGHRYFFAIHLLGIILCLQYLSSFSTQIKYLFYSFIFSLIILGNFLYYPGKTLGDATLAYRSYFALEQQIKLDFADSIQFHSYAPIANPSHAKSLNNKSLDIVRISNNDFSEIPAILQSNLNAEFDHHAKSFLATNWYGKSYEKGGVFVNVFLNPAFYNKPPHWKLRTPGSLESYMEYWKKEWKNE